MLCAVVLHALAASPEPAPAPVVLLVSRVTGASADDAAQKAAQVTEVLEKLGVRIAPADRSAERLRALEAAPSRCQADRNCLASLGRRLQASVVVTLDVGLVLDEYALRIEAIDSRTGTLLGAHPTSGAWAAVAARLASELGPMAYSITTHLEHDSPAPVAAAQPEPRPAPVPAPAPALAEAPPPAPRTRLAPVVLGAGAGAAAIATVVLAVMGLSHKGTVDGWAQAGPPYPVTIAQAEQTARSANLELSLAIAGAALTVALAAAALLVGLSGS